MSDVSPSNKQDLSSQPNSRKINRLKVSLCADWQPQADLLAEEEPLEINLRWKEVSYPKARTWLVTMRTPGNDLDLVVGMLLTHGIIDSINQIVSVEHDEADNSEQNAGNRVVATLAIVPDLDALNRAHMSYGSCGVCGSTSLKALALHFAPQLDAQQAWLLAENLMSYPKLLRQHQPLFDATGAAHGAGYIVENELVAVAEDVGRHNAVDKLIGKIQKEQLWHPQGTLVLSGRVSFELMQKAVAAALPVVVAVGAPTALALKVAQQFDITLIGFTREYEFNLYHGQQRIQKSAHTEYQADKL